jgi:hypothetical protein
MLRLLLLVGLVALASQDYVPLRTLHVDNTKPCADNSTGGSEATPFCSLRYVSTIAKAGDTFLIASRRDGSGPVEFTRSGTADAPIIYRSTHPDGTTIGVFVDVKDEEFKPGAAPGVFTLAGAPSGYVWQTYFGNAATGGGILVDDPNPSKYTMVDTDGPLQLAKAPDDATLAKQEGTFRYVSGVLHVHPYGSRTPSATATDLVIGVDRALQFTKDTAYNVFENVNVSYVGSSYSFQVKGTGHTFKNINYQGVSLWWEGSGHKGEGLFVTHVHQRDPESDWTWHYEGIGTAATIKGWNHTIRDIEVAQNWNSSIATEGATGTIIDGARVHSSPNHCDAGNAGTGTIVRNAVLYNCQDYQWTKDISGSVLEHVVLAGDSMGFESVNKPLGPITIRNSIMRGSFTWVRGPQSGCTWEPGSVIEHNVFESTASIERCADMKTYPLATYIAKCESGEFTGCATFRNNTLVEPAQWATVVKDGMWRAELGDQWDVSLVSGSPAIDIGASSTPTDIIGRPRPTGDTCDAGIYESCTCPSSVVRRPGVRRGRTK